MTGPDPSIPLRNQNPYGLAEEVIAACFTTPSGMRLLNYWMGKFVLLKDGFHRPCDRWTVAATVRGYLSLGGEYPTVSVINAVVKGIRFHCAADALQGPVSA
jgi:hypothetical protein